MTREETVERVHHMLNAWNARNLDLFTSCFATDGYWHDLGMPRPPAVGRAAIRAFAESALRAFPDFTYTIRGSICVADDGASCVLPWAITATNTGVLDPPGFAPTGRRVQFEGLDYFVFQVALVTRLETRFDLADPLEQLFGLRLRARAGSWQERSLVAAQRLGAAWLRRTLAR